MKKLISLIYPVTKAKLHRALNFAGMLLTAGAVVFVWASSLDVGSSIGATVVLVTTFLTNAKKAVAKLNAAVDSLPIPADDEPTKPLLSGDTAFEVSKLPPPSSSSPVVAMVALGTALLLAGPARADGGQFGGCLTPSLCAGPSAAITVVSFNLADSTFSGGVSPGLGYGLTWTPPTAPWAAMGADLYASFRLGQGLPNQAAFAVMGHFADYIFLGIGPTVTQRAGQSALVQWSILGGMGVPLGGTPKYLAAHR